VRTGQVAADTARIILDFEGSAEYRVFSLPDPYRLIVDLRGPNADVRPGKVVRLASKHVDPKRARCETCDARRAKPAEVAAKPAVERQSAAPVLASLPPRSLPAPPAVQVPPSESSRPFKVMIDPGHGGKDPGARGIGGIEEKDVVLSIALELAAELRTDRQVEVLLTRSDDRYLTLEDRTALANAAEADLFVSVHANASTHRSQSGIEVYYLNNTNNRGTLRLAAMENGLRWNPKNPALERSIPDLSYILSDLRQTYKVEESQLLAHQLGQAMVSRLRPTYEGVDDFGVKEGPFYVLVGAYMPCVLVEVSYLTHPLEGARLATADYRRALADGIYQGIRSYIVQTAMAKNL
jgi:N-acetylmuramoyl-L-alanine amidase